MRKLREAMVICGWAALLFVISLGIADAVLAPAPLPKQPDFVDTLLASKAVVVAIRIAVLFAAMFVALSTVALIARRQWLTRIGPVEVEKVSGLGAENQRLREELDEATKIMNTLRQKVSKTDRALSRRSNE